MSLERLIRQLGKEARRSPKKAALLGVLALVAAWFWAPLLWQWIMPGQPAEEAPIAQAAVAGGASAEAVTAPGGPAASNPAGAPAVARAAAGPQSTSRPDWRQLVEWKGADQFVQPSELPPGLRDQFVPPVPPEPEVAAKTAAEVAPVEAQTPVDPASLGLVLSSTIVGPQRRAARINNKTYQPGQTIAVSKDGRQFEFVLAEVHPRHVVLTDQSARYELSLPKPDLSDAIRPMQAGRN